MKINVKVYPNSKEQKVEKINESQYKVYLKSPAENNKANMELIKLIKKEYNASDIKIIKGIKKRNKVLYVEE